MIFYSGNYPVFNFDTKESPSDFPKRNIAAYFKKKKTKTNILNNFPVCMNKRKKTTTKKGSWWLPGIKF